MESRNGVLWVNLCPVCTRPKSMVAEAEAQLPREATQVQRCGGCGRALWYRSRGGVQAQRKETSIWATRSR